MTRSYEDPVDQAPKFHDDNNQKEEQKEHPERVKTTTGTTPAYPEYEPPRIDNINPHVINRRTKKVMMGAGTIAALIAAGGFYLAGKGQGKQEVIDELMNPQGSNSAPIVPGAVETEITQDESDTAFASHDRVSRLKYVFEKFDVNNLLEKAAQDAKNGGYIIENPNATSISTAERPAEKRDYSEADILSEFEFGMFAASTQGDSPEEVREARKLLSIFVDSDHPSFDATRTKIGNGLGPMFENLKLENSWPRVIDGSYKGHDFQGGQAQFIEAKNGSNGESVMFLFQLIQTNDDDNEIWMLTDTFKATDTVRQDVASLLPGNS